MKKIIFAILVILPSAFVVEDNSDREIVSPFSLCKVLGTCDKEN
ncbi:hypothetical protein QE250_04565 [Chromatiaceae bacterium AAb-1]|nr:hypothetical protein [Chromatiaceae bacterium AAb-1]